MIRYHLDQHVDSAVAKGLQRRGIDVTTTAEAGLQGASDEKHLEYALNEGRVIFTQDDDFTRFHQQAVPHAGIVYCKQQTRSIGEVVLFLELLAQCVDSEELINRIEYF